MCKGTKRFGFATEMQAIAFREGVEYVNDSAVQVLSIKRKRSKWTEQWFVTVQDKD